MVVGEHGVEEKVVVSREEEVVAMAIATSPAGRCCFLMRRSRASHASERTRSDQGKQQTNTYTHSSPLVARAWSFRIWILSIMKVS